MWSHAVLPFLSIYMYTHACVFYFLCACVRACVYVCACTHVCMYVCMYVCMIIISPYLLRHWLLLKACAYAYVYVCAHVCVRMCTCVCAFPFGIRIIAYSLSFISPTATINFSGDKQSFSHSFRVEVHIARTQRYIQKTTT